MRDRKENKRYVGHDEKVSNIYNWIPKTIDTKIEEIWEKILAENFPKYQAIRNIRKFFESQPG